MFWDGDRWIDAPALEANEPTAGRHGRRRDRLATLPFLLLVTALLTPALSAQAAGPDGSNTTNARPTAKPTATPRPTPAPSAVPTQFPTAAPTAGPVQAPYGAPIAVPGRIEAEHYDRGGEGVAYHDLTALNEGGALRTDGVDIKPSPAGEAGQTVGWAQAGEWLEYTVSIAASGTYDVTARIAAPAAGGSFHVEVDGRPSSAPIAIPSTGSWDVQRSVTVASAVALTAGTHLLRVAFDTNGATLGGFVGDLNYLDVVASAPAATATPAPTPLPCPASLQEAIDATETGGTLRLGACTFHEAVTVGRPMTITGSAVIDGDGVRSSWMTVRAADVTVDGLTMRNAAAGGYQSGSLNVDGATGFTLRNATLAGGGYANLRLWGGSGHSITNSTISSARAIGILGWSVTDSRISASRITGNNTTSADAGNEAGGIKLGQASRVTITANEVDDNAGVGIWCDVYCVSTTIGNNRVHDNTHQGILYEISSGGSIIGNRVWENGFRFPAWGWGGGIVVSSSGTTEVASNVVAWNADGIVVISQNRTGSPGVRSVSVHDNTVAMAPQSSDGSDRMALAWLQDWSGVMYDAGSANAGSGNRYWATLPEPQWARFGWNGPRDTLATFNATPGEEGGIYLASGALATALADAGVPGSAKVR